MSAGDESDFIRDWQMMLIQASGIIILVFPARAIAPVTHPQRPLISSCCCYSCSSRGRRRASRQRNGRILTHACARSVKSRLDFRASVDIARRQTRSVYECANMTIDSGNRHRQSSASSSDNDVLMRLFSVPLVENSSFPLSAPSPPLDFSEDRPSLHRRRASCAHHLNEHSLPRARALS